MDNDMCDSLIELFNEKEESRSRFDSGEQFDRHRWAKSAAGFDMYNFTENNTDDVELYDKCIDCVMQAAQEYRYRIKQFFQWTPDGVELEHGFEAFRIKRYKNDDHFEPHVDVLDYVDARRYLTIIWCLNKCDGGEFSFDNFDLTYTPNKGTLIMFPSVWLFPHKTAPVKSGEKFILQSYAHYL